MNTKEDAGGDPSGSAMASSTDQDTPYERPRPEAAADRSSPLSPTIGTAVPLPSSSLLLKELGGGAQVVVPPRATSSYGDVAVLTTPASKEAPPPTGRDNHLNSNSKVQGNLLDVDLIRGSSAFHTKPAKDTAQLGVGAIKVLFFPLCYGWWREKIQSTALFGVGCFLYVAQGSIFILYLTGLLPAGECFKSSPLSPPFPAPQCSSTDQAAAVKAMVGMEVCIPVVLWACCALGYGHLVAAASNQDKRGGRSSSSAVVAGGRKLSSSSSTGGWGGGASDEVGSMADSVSAGGGGGGGGVAAGGTLLAEEEEDDDDDESDDEDPYSEELQEKEEKILLQQAAATRRQQQQQQQRQPQRPQQKHRPSASIDAAEREEEGMWGLGTGGSNMAMGAVRVTLFDYNGDVMKVPMTLSQVRAYIVERASTVKQQPLYRYAAPVGAISAAMLPCLFDSFTHARKLLLIRVMSMLSVLYIAWPTYDQLAIAESTYSQRTQYAKYFAAITSLTKARRHNIPHFSLKNVLNIKMWLALRAGRSWLRRYPQQRIADTVVSSTFRGVLLLLAILCFEVFMRQEKRPFLSQLLHWELMVWGVFSSIYLLRYMVLGSRINAKYHDTTALLTEQINVQLRIFENCCRSNDRHKREKLQISNSVLKLTQKLLRENDSSPNKLSGLSMNPVLYNITRVVLLSALSAAASDTMGFKLKMWKLLKIK